MAGRASKVHAFILEGKEDWGSRGGSNPVMQLAGYYAKMLEANWDTTVVKNTLLPAVGVEVFGHGFRYTKHLLCIIAYFNVVCAICDCPLNTC